MILYKCHLFGINPPTLTSTIESSGNSAHQHLHTPIGGHQYSTVAWRLHDLFNYDLPTTATTTSLLKIKKRHVMSNNNPGGALLPPPISSDCSLCLNIDRKYQCVWCNSQCQHSNQCTELAAPTCPPPRIDSVSFLLSLLEGLRLVIVIVTNIIIIETFSANYYADFAGKVFLSLKKTTCSLTFYY